MEKEKKVSEESVFEILRSINVNDKTREKMGLKYLSWAFAWDTLKKHYPDAYSTVYTRTVQTTETQTFNETDGSVRTITTVTENEVPYFTDGKTCYVKVGVTIEDKEYVELYPIMDLKNNAAMLSLVSMTMVNKSIQRAFVKACARHGLGLYIYAGEDLPDAEKINYNEAKNTADNLPLKEIDEATFDSIKQNIIQKLTTASYTQETLDAITQYGNSILRNKRVTQLNYEDIADRSAIQKIDAYIVAVESL